MTTDLIDEMDRAWSELWAAQATLSEADLTAPGTVGDWARKDVLTHIGRWADTAAVVIEGLVAGTLPSGFTRRFRDTEAVNQGWYQEDREVGVEEARRRCEAAHQRLRAALASVPADRLQGRIRNWAFEAGPEHYTDHLPSFRA